MNVAVAARAPVRSDGVGAVRLLLIAGPALLLAGALGFQFVGHYAPCEMCLWQRWPHLASVAIAAASFALPRAHARVALALAALFVLTSAALGAFHMGVEQHWWTGPAHCTPTVALGGGDYLRTMLAAPIVRCDVAAWRLFGVSMAGWNALISATIGAFALARVAR